MKCEETFERIFQREPDGKVFCPYRVCPIGAHSDHNLGKITGLAIDRGIHIVYSRENNGVIELKSLQFEKPAQWHIRQVENKPVSDWADYLRGATIALGRRYQLSYGLSGVIEGTMPIGGLSSSAAVIIAFLAALSKVNGIRMTENELIETALTAERDYVGVSVGTLDQSCEIYSKKDHLLYLDTKDGSFELIEKNNRMKDFSIAVFFSGIERNLAGSGYNMRVDEAKSAAYALMAYSGMEYGKFNEAVLRNVPYETYLKYKDRLPYNWMKRAEHWYTEFMRVEKGAEAWRKGDISEYGRLSFESGYSSIYNWETGSKELKTLYELLRNTDGVYGGRFSGAGFKGCCMALIDPSFSESIERKVEEGYLKVFPELKGRYSFHLCESADGIKLD